MILVPGGSISYTPDYNEKFIIYPAYSKEKVKVDKFYIDIYPVTNKQYYDFTVSSGYIPKDSVNYLKHWKKGKYIDGSENHPVVYVSLEDATAYANWSRKRLPIELEWQFAAQGTDGRLWPWGKDFKDGYCNNATDKSTPVDKYKKGKSPFGTLDMVGNIWQLTNDIYHNGSYRFVMIKGGSFFKPTSSWWYVQGGPQALNMTQMLLLVSSGFDRNETVGFRCVMDAQ
jgi:formylglycine-generating enzyme required for sulfatase activity